MKHAQTSLVAAALALIGAGPSALPHAPQTQEWPLKLVTVSVTGADDRITVETYAEIRDCQPEVFDPRTNRLRAVDEARPREGYVAQGTDCPVLIDGVFESGDRKIKLNAPFSATTYDFLGTSVSHVLDLQRNGARHALYTHVDQFRFSADSRTVALVNWVRTAPGEWRLLRRVIDVASKATVALPEILCTRNLADVGSSGVVTYGIDYGPACVWDPAGRLLSAFRYPSPALSNEGRFSGLGLLPAQPPTVYFVYQPEEGGCAVLLQHVHRPESHRRVPLTVPGQTPSPDPVNRNPYVCAPGQGLQIDWADLTLQGGQMRYRASASTRGDVNNDWGPWLTAR